jgi:nucleotide-binding universal stress UspA family protein
MFNRILVPLDGSELAERALEPALKIGRRQKGEVILLRVPVYKQVMVPSTAGYAYLASDQSFEEQEVASEAYLKEVQRLKSKPGLTIRTKVVGGDIAGTIVDTAVEEKADLIVMTTHGYSGFTRWMLGSVTERLLRGSPCPVLVIRHEEPLANAVITLDGSQLAEAALEPGLEMARLFESNVTLLRVDQGEKLSSVELGLLEMARSGLGKDVAQVEGDQVKRYLQNIANEYETPELKINIAITTGAPAQGILEFIEPRPIDLIIMATHGLTGLRRWVYGSVTEKVMRNANCAMLIVRPPDEALK